MISVERNELRSIRMRCAVSICEKFPNLYNKIYGPSKTPISDYESMAAEILAVLCEAEPSLKIVLAFISRKK